MNFFYKITDEPLQLFIGMSGLLCSQSLLMRLTGNMETISVIVCCNFGQGYSGTSTAEYISGFVRWGERIYWDFVEES